MGLVEVKDLLSYSHAMTDSTDRYPKRRRFTYVNRIQNLTLDVYCDVKNYLDKRIDKKSKKELLTKIRMSLNSLLGLIEISLDRGFIEYRQCKIWTEKVVTLQGSLHL